MSLYNTNCGNAAIGQALGRGKSVYFVGIGGIGMQGLALLLKERGYCVNGSDLRAEGEGICRLRAHGIGVDVGHRRENIKNPNLVVYTLALPDTCPELLAAAEQGILAVTRAEMLGYLMSAYQNSVAVAGTHGKSTTTGMLAAALTSAGHDPTVLSGASLVRGGLPLRIGSGDTAVCEACEYMDSFLRLAPKIAVILNIEAEHVDWFPTLEDAQASFFNFASRAKTVVLPSDGMGTAKIRTHLGDRAVTFGLDENATSSAAELTWENGCASFVYRLRRENVGRVRLLVPGMHNVYNSLAALAVCGELGVCLADALVGIGTFTGVEGRLERRGTWRGVQVYVDYAHHPTEIAASLSALRTIAGAGRLFCIYQPHTYSRTAAFFDRFAEVLSAADRAVLLDVYAAREENTSGVTSAALAAVTRNARYLSRREDVIPLLAKETRRGDTVVFMGAGDISNIPDLLSLKE